MKKFLGICVLSSFIFSANLFSSEEGAAKTSGSGLTGSVSSASSSSGASKQMGLTKPVVLKRTGSMSIMLLPEQVLLLNSPVIMAAIEAEMAKTHESEPIVFEIKLPAYISFAAVRTTAEILERAIQRHSLEKAVREIIQSSESVCSVLCLLNYLQASVLEHLVVHVAAEYKIFSMTLHEPKTILDRVAQKYAAPLHNLFLSLPNVSNFEYKRQIRFNRRSWLPRPIYTIAWSPDNKHLASAHSDNTVWILDVDDILADTAGDVYTVDGTRMELRAYWNGSERIADIESTAGTKVLTGHNSKVCCVAWDPDGKRLANASEDGSVRIWDAVSGDCFQMFTCPACVYCVAWSPDGKTIACGSGNKVLIWDVVSQTFSKTFSGHFGSVYALSWSPDGKKLASAGHRVFVWDVDHGECIKTLKGGLSAAFLILAKSINTLSWSPDGKRLLGLRSSGLEIWDEASGTSLGSLSCESNRECNLNFISALWSPDSNSFSLLAEKNRMDIWDIKDGGLKRRCAKTIAGLFDGKLSWSPDRKRFAVGDTLGNIDIYGDSGLHDCSPLQELFMLANLSKTSELWCSICAGFTGILSRTGIISDQPELAFLSKWASVYNSLPKAGKNLIDPSVRNLFDLFNRNTTLVWRSFLDTLLAAARAEEHGDGASSSGASSSEASSRE